LKGGIWMERPREPRRAPLSFTQLAHWNLRREANGRPIRQVVSATRLLGHLSRDVLLQSVDEAVSRHEALRTHIVFADGGAPLQEVIAKSCKQLAVIHLDGIPQISRGAAVAGQIEDAVVDIDDYTTGPLFKAVLLSLAASEHVLILALDHIVSDGASLNILLREILADYSELIKGETVKTAQVPIQFIDYAARQQAQSLGAFSKAADRLGSIGRTRFPNSIGVTPEGNRNGWGLNRFTIDRNLCNALRAWARRNRTTLVMATFTAYAALVLRWCEVSETVIQFMTDGRIHTELSRTVGYLAFPLYIKLELEGRDTFVDLLKRATEEYCRAWDEADFGYAHSQVPRPAFTHNTIFNWLPAVAESHTGSENEPRNGCALSHVEFAQPMLKSLNLDQEPMMAFLESPGQVIKVDVMYPLDRFSDAMMEMLSRDMKAFLHAMAAGRSVKNISITRNL
jgi:hypothetical protein